MKKLPLRKKAALVLTTILSSYCLFSGLTSLIRLDLVNGVVSTTFGVGFLAMLIKMLREVVPNKT